VCHAINCNTENLRVNNFMRSTKQNVLCEWFWKRDRTATNDPAAYNLLENYMLWC